MMQLQTYDGVVKSVLEVRRIWSDLSDEEFAQRYEEHFKVTAKGVLGILRAAEVNR